MDAATAHIVVTNAADMHAVLDRVRSLLADDFHVVHSTIQLEPADQPPLVDVDDLADRVALLRSLGFRGSWTIEFVHGLLTARDRPEVLVEQAIADLAILRQVLAG